MTSLTPIPYTPEGPQPLLRAIPAGAPYPVHALGPLRPAVEAVQGMTQTPVAIPAGSALAVASLAVQGFADVETLGGDRPCSLFFVTIAQSGERKSSCDKPLMRALREYEAKQAEVYADAFKAWASASEMFEAKKKGALRDLASGDDKKRTQGEVDFAALGAPPRRPLLADRTASEPTLEGLFLALQISSPSVGVFNDEAAQFLGGHGMGADHRMKTLAGLNSLWDGSEIKRTRAGDGVYTLRGRRVALHLMAQPVAAAGLLGDPLASGLGFLPRCLICEPVSTIGTRLSANARCDDGAVENFGAWLTAILETPMPVAADGQTLQPRRLGLSPEARALLTQLSDDVEADQARGGDLAHITGAASKAAEQACRIAAVLTLWADLEAQEVSVATMADAIELAQFYLGEASRLASVATVSAKIADAEALNEWLREKWPHADITTRELVQSGPGALRESPKARAALGLLEEHGWLVALGPEAVVRGACRKEAWRIVPVVDGV
jgi:hypothetical protein